MSSNLDTYDEQVVRGVDPAAVDIGDTISANGYQWIITHVEGDTVRAKPVLAVTVTGTPRGTEWFSPLVGTGRTVAVVHNETEWVLAEDYVTDGCWRYIPNEHAEVQE